MTEQWKDIPAFPGYQVSEQGRVRSHNKTTFTEHHGIRRWKDRILKQKSSYDGSKRVCLWKDGQEHTILVHRLVAEAFCTGGELYSDLTVNHIDGNRSNNRASNLEWMTLRDNILYGYEHNQYPQTNCQLISEDGAIHNFRSLTQACTYLGRCHGYIKRKNKTGDVFTDLSGGKYQLVVL